MKTINITNINIKEIRIVFTDDGYDASVAYAQVADDGSEFQERTMRLDELDTTAKGRITRMAESIITAVKAKEGM